MSDGNGESTHEHAHDDLTESDLFRVMDALQFQEIDHHGPESAGVHALRREAEPLLTEVIFTLHDTRAIGEGQQWTIPVGLSCGFEGEIIFRVRRLGPDHGAAR